MTLRTLTGRELWLAGTTATSGGLGIVITCALAERDWQMLAIASIAYVGGLVMIQAKFRCLEEQVRKDFTARIALVDEIYAEHRNSLAQMHEQYMRSLGLRGDPT